MTECSVESCEKKVRGHGLCSGHLHRLERYGFPTGKPDTRPKLSCSVCQGKHYARGYCHPHYKRWWKYGDATAGGTPSGEVRRWVDEVAIHYKGDDCLIFPYGTGHGYGRININCVPMDAHVYILGCVKGPKPTPKHESCHSCGRGSAACVNPRHLYWGTRSQNVSDRWRHQKELAA